MNKIKKNDEVIVLAGKDKGRRGKVEAMVGADRVLVSGVNVVKKAVKPAMGVSGGIVEKSVSIHISNIALFNLATGKADRVGFKPVDGKKVRFFKSTGEVVKV